ncbi:hypothetical protein [Rhodopirellula sp. SWK7]|uniref:hypothetical protein n=1 Tax=Rhodopirellula sp. SWK7 TaxID=595460 RepID=UPI0002BDB984|nr:hypothetical protein [Rhodopirellula sp. SWK7]EMI46048.1 secreted protein [Rhodopirellula sp. SWK7]
MRICFNPVACLGLIVALGTTGVVNADETSRLERLPLTADDISSVIGLNIYKFRIAMDSRTEFQIAVSVQNAADAKSRFLNRQTFTSDEGTKAVDLLLSFLPRDDTVRGVLLSQDEEIEYRVRCSRCYPSGITTIISLPLSEIPGTQKTLIPMTADRSEKLSGEHETCLIAILASEAGNPVSMQNSYPRAKISVIFSD